MSIKIGTAVKNNLGWTGKVVDRPSHWGKEPKGGDPVVYVHWQEREDMINNKSDRGNHAIKDPVISAIPSELTIVN